MNLVVTQADYFNPRHAKDIPYLLDCYAADPMGGGKALSEDIKNKLVAELTKLPHALTVLAYVDDKPAGLTNGFEAFSTFACKPLINIHDLVVLPEFRGKGVAQAMLAEVERIAKVKGCCKLTLEVLSNNTAAMAAYTKYGFSGYQLDPSAGHALFWQKPL